jgi:proteasome activator subunit 4
MDNQTARISAILTSDNFQNGNEMSRATSPGGEPAETNGISSDALKKARVRPRTYPYFQYLPYQAEDDSQREHNLHEILKCLSISVKAGDFSPGAVHWTRELRGWLSLKFDPTREERIKLVKLYYELSLAPGIDPNVAERFASMFMLLTKYGHPTPPSCV